MPGLFFGFAPTASNAGRAAGVKAGVGLGMTRGGTSGVGMMIGVVSITGLGLKLATCIVGLAQGSLFLTALLTMIAALVLGTGLPTSATYIITSIMAAPALTQLGVPVLAAHMFVFYFGILADLTPPVALACFAAAPIARESGLRISFEAVKVAAAGFVIPFMAVYTPALMLQDGGPLAAAMRARIRPARSARLGLA